MGLAGKRILVTRPRELAQPLAAAIAAQGGDAVLFPALEILAPADPAAARERLARLETYDFVFFVSPTAVRRASALRPEAWPAGLRAYAVGEGTRRALEAAGVRGATAPRDGADSEALLALADLQRLEGKRALIVRGEGGRGLLARTLAARGALVEFAECYRRAPPRSPAPGGRFDAICVNSSEALENLVVQLGSVRLQDAVLFVPHERVAQAARALGLRPPVIAGPGDDQVLARLVAYFGGAK
ncbi:MAG TPA: uroporphyrinogen-III synthase [Burkholderiales bacterium]|nr:uroporphyrinogen-III synthase [Burkholderiales bacterium]